jgi:hypothetical protein
MALNLSDTPAQRQREREADAVARGQQVRPEDDPVGYASLHWALYPVMAEVPMLPVIPAGMWPYESPLVKRARADAGENPHEVPEEYVEANKAAVYGTMPDEETVEAARRGDIVFRGAVAEGLRQAVVQASQRDERMEARDQRQAQRQEHQAEREVQREEHQAEREAQREAPRTQPPTPGQRTATPPPQRT